MLIGQSVGDSLIVRCWNPHHCLIYSLATPLQLRNQLLGPLLSSSPPSPSSPLRPGRTQSVPMLVVGVSVLTLCWTHWKVRYGGK